MNLANLAGILGHISENQTLITGFSIDSRQVKPGHVFVALRGERVDGHQFIKQAAEQGAIAALCSKPDPAVKIVQLVVPDVTKALGQIASVHRQSINCPIIALTGSNGKTTVKEMIASILPKPSHATPGNLNNHLGAPLSVLQLTPAHRFAVFELGANHLGEIAYTAAIVQPKVALINNIAPAHIGEFGSIEGVARAKGEIYQALGEEGIAVVNEDSDYAHFWDDILVDKTTLRFSLNKPSDLYAQHISFNEQGCAQFELVFPHREKLQLTLNVPGEHTIRNALAAAACSYAVGLSLSDIEQGLSQFRGVAGRMTFLQGKNNSLIIDDSYNANLHSALAAVEVLAKRKGRRILVLGDMGELGDWAEHHHEEIGHAALRHGIDLLMTCGTYSLYTSKAFGPSAKHYKNQEELARDLLDNLDADTTVLIKGSRSSAMEKIVRQLLG